MILHLAVMQNCPTGLVETPHTPYNTNRTTFWFTRTSRFCVNIKSLVQTGSVCSMSGSGIMTTQVLHCLSAYFLKETLTDLNFRLIPEPAAGCHTSPESFMSNMEDNEKTKLCDGSLMTQRTEVQTSDGVYVHPRTFSSNLQDCNDSAFFTMNPNQLWPDVASCSSSLP